MTTTQNEVIYQTRDEWLQAASDLLIDTVFDLKAPHASQGLQLFEQRVSCGYPIGSRPSASGKTTTLGVCHPRSQSADGHNEIWISPELADPSLVLATLAHELIHAADDCQHGHKGEFAKWARAIGLEGKLTATFAGVELQQSLDMIVAACGAYPHAEISLSARKKQPSRMVKIECNACDAVWRMSKKWINPTAMVCPCCVSDDLTIYS